LDSTIAADSDVAASLGDNSVGLSVDDGSISVVASWFVDLERSSAVSDDDLSFNNYSSLVQDVLWGQDVSVDLSLDSDDSSGTKNVVGVGRSNSWKVVSSKHNFARSSNVDHPFGLEVAVVQNVVCSLGQDRCINGDVVSIGVVDVASENDGVPRNGNSSVVAVAGQTVLVVDIALLGSIKVGVHASSVSIARSQDSGSKISFSSEGSSDEEIFFSSWVWDVVSLWVNSSRNPVGIGSNNNRVWDKVIVSVSGLDFVTNRVTSSDVQVVSDSQSTLNITGVGVPVSERNDVEVSERGNGVFQWEVESIAAGFEVWAQVSIIWWGWWGGWWWAGQSVELVRFNDVSDNDDSVVHSVVVVEVGKRSQDASFNSSAEGVDVSGDVSQRVSGEVVQHVFGTSLEVLSRSLNIDISASALVKHNVDDP